MANYEEVFKNQFPELLKVLKRNSISDYKFEPREPHSYELRGGCCFTLSYLLTVEGLELELTNQSHEGGGSYGYMFGTMNFTSRRKLTKCVIDYLRENGLQID